LLKFITIDTSKGIKFTDEPRLNLKRSLLQKFIPYRQIATIAKCSSDAISAELRVLKAEN